MVARLVIVGFVGCALALMAMSGATDVDPNGPPPWPLPHLAAVTLDGDAWRSSRDLLSPTAVMYVVHGCPHCDAEMDRWRALVTENEAVGVWLIVSPASDPGDPSWIPSALRRQTVLDTDGSIARALGVTRVPTTLYLDSRRVVRARTVGQTSRRVIEERLRSVADKADKSEPNDD